MTTGVQISTMPSAASMAAGDVVPIVNGVTNKKYDLGTKLAALDSTDAALSASLAAKADSSALAAKADTSALAAIAFNGSATNLITGTVPAARMPAHTGDVTSTAGTVALTIPNNTVTNAKAAQMAANTIKGNNSGATANSADLTTAQVKSMLAIASTDVSGLAAIATSGSAADLSAGTIPTARMPAHTGDVTSTSGSVALTIGAATVTLGKMANLAANSFIGNNTGAAATPIALTPAQAKGLLAITAADIVSGLAAIATSGSAADLSAGTIPTARMPAHTGDVTSSSGSVALTIANSAVTLAKMADVATGTIFYRKTAGSGAPETQTLATLKTDLGLTGTNSGDQTITLTGDVTGSGSGSFSATIANASVTLAKMANLAANSIIGNNTGASAAPTALTATQVKTLLAIVAPDVTFTATPTGGAARTQGARNEDIFHDADFTTLQQAVTAATGKTLFVTSSRTITSAITVPDGTTIVGMGGVVTVSVSEVNAFELGNNCTISGLEIVGPLNSAVVVDFSKSNGVYASGKRNVRVEGNYIRGWNANGIQVRDCNNVAINGNILHNNYYGNGSSSDVTFYSGSGGARIAITNNLCLSNNSQGIFFNALGLDSDAVISGNITDCLNSDFTAKNIPTTAGSGSTNRRHGILTSYNGGSGGGRVVVTGNVCRNTAWTGIYCQNGSSNSTPVLVTSNVCVKNGYELGNSLSAGIYIDSKGDEHVTSNLVLDYVGSIAGIVADRSGPLTLKTSTIHDNYIENSATAGIFCGTYVSDISIKFNTINAPAGRGIDIALTSGTTTLGNFVIEGNYIRRTTGNAIGIAFSPGTGQRRSIVKGNRLIGPGGGTSNSANVGINWQVPYLDVTDNWVSDFYYGIHYAAYLTASTRFFTDIVADRNIVENCTQGICLSALDSSVTVPVEGNIFRGVTTKIGGGNIAGTAAGRIGIRFGDKIIANGYTAAPTTGTWAVGDRAQNDTPAAAGVPGWYCTTAGTPGTWKAEAALAA